MHFRLLTSCSSVCHTSAPLTYLFSRPLFLLFFRLLTHLLLCHLLTTCSPVTYQFCSHTSCSVTCSPPVHLSHISAAHTPLALSPAHHLFTCLSHISSAHTPLLTPPLSPLLLSDHSPLVLSPAHLSITHLLTYLFFLFFRLITRLLLFRLLTTCLPVCHISSAHPPLLTPLLPSAHSLFLFSLFTTCSPACHTYAHPPFLTPSLPPLFPSDHALSHTPSTLPPAHHLLTCQSNICSRTSSHASSSSV